jgi:hypothetical protein
MSCPKSRTSGSSDTHVVIASLVSGASTNSPGTPDRARLVVPHGICPSGRDGQVGRAISVVVGPRERGAQQVRGVEVLDRRHGDAVDRLRAGARAPFDDVRHSRFGGRRADRDVVDPVAVRVAEPVPANQKAS